MPQGFTGTGASITFATTAFVGKYREIGQLVKAIPAVDSTTLDIAKANNAQKIPGDNPDPEPVRCRVRFAGAQAHPAIGTVETITITLPKETAGSSNAATVAGTGFIMSWTPLPNLQRNQLNEAEIVFQYDGGTGPTYTVES